MSGPLCPFCYRKAQVGGVGICHVCRTAYDAQVIKRGDGTIASLIRWAAKRARRLPRRKEAAPPVAIVCQGEKIQIYGTEE